jgi:excisionase family DNA binding protein
MTTVDASYLTSHEVARLLGVSASAVLSWIDKGWIKAHRTPGGHRRVEKLELIRFLRERNMPVPRVLTGVKRLLIIDDDPGILKTTKRVLKHHAPDLTLETSEGAVDGLLKIGTFRPDAVVLDAYMPGMNGIEVCQRIRNAPETSHILVIAVTGHPSPSIASAFVEAGAAACLNKPIDVDELLEALGLSIGQSKGSAKREHS